VFAPTPPSLPGHLAPSRTFPLVGEGGRGTWPGPKRERPRRTVALKVIRAGLTTPELLWRFEREFQSLGRLQHPGIAQIYEAGTAQSDFGPRPFFAMEFIRGVSLVEYANAHQMSTRQRLELMAKVCEAVHPAHQ